MFKLVSERLAWIDVIWPGLDADGQPVTNRIEAQVALVDTADMARLPDFDDEAKPQVETWRFFVRDWRGVADETGASLPMTDDAIKRLCQVPMFIAGFAKCYAEAWMGVTERRSLSSASPANGPVDGAPASQAQG